MSVLKRAWANLMYRKLQTIGIIVIFTVLFGVSLICIMVYNTTDKSVELSQKSIANAITIQPPVMLGADGDVQNVTLSETNLSLMIKPDYVAEYNPIVQYYSFFCTGNSHKDDLSITAINNSAYYETFSSGSFYLEEGKHFSSADGATDGVLISKPLADEKHLKVGDTIKLKESELNKLNWMIDSLDIPYEVKIRGIFNSDDKKAIENAKSWIYMPYQSLVKYWKAGYKNESRNSVHEIQRVIVYLKDPSDIDRYLEYIKNNLNVEKIADMSEGIDYYSINDIKAGTFDTTDPKKLTEQYSTTLLGEFFYKEWYYILIDRDWYKLVGTPMENIRDVFQWIGVIMGGATFLIMVLLCFFTIRKRNKEFGILLSMGERKWKILLQIVVETVIMVSVAAIIATVIVPGTTNKFGNQALSSMSERTTLQQKQKKENQTYNQGTDESANMEMRNFNEDSSSKYTTNDTSNIRSKSHLDFEISKNVVLVYFVSVFLLVAISMLLQIQFILRISPASLVRR